MATEDRVLTIISDDPPDGLHAEIRWRDEEDEGILRMSVETLRRAWAQMGEALDEFDNRQPPGDA